VHTAHTLTQHTHSTQTASTQHTPQGGAGGGADLKYTARAHTHSHTHSTYRKAELEVAQTVTMLSRKPGDPKLLKKVHTLVKAAQTDRKNMEKDHEMLSSLERKIASLQVCFSIF
jgi:hypothetical protein